MIIHYNTVTPLLKEVLDILLKEEIFAPFRLVGGTNLSLRLGHRMSDDIDLFTDAEYGSLDFRVFEKLELHKRRHEWEHEDEQVLNSLINFEEANEMEDPICLEHKDWDNIKLDIINEVTSFVSTYKLNSD